MAFEFYSLVAVERGAIGSRGHILWCYRFAVNGGELHCFAHFVAEGDAHIIACARVENVERHSDFIFSAHAAEHGLAVSKILVGADFHLHFIGASVGPENGGGVGHILHQIGWIGHFQAVRSERTCRADTVVEVERTGVHSPIVLHIAAHTLKRGGSGGGVGSGEGVSHVLEVGIGSNFHGVLRSALHTVPSECEWVAHLRAFLWRNQHRCIECGILCAEELGGVFVAVAVEHANGVLIAGAVVFGNGVSGVVGDAEQILHIFLKFGLWHRFGHSIHGVAHIVEARPRQVVSHLAHIRHGAGVGCRFPCHGWWKRRVGIHGALQIVGKRFLCAEVIEVFA